MAPKQAEKIDNPPAAASSSEEEEESGSSGEEESGSSDDDIQSKLTQKPPVPPASTNKKPESDSEESESESDSDPEPPTKTRPLNAVVSTKPKPDTSGSVAESSKRPLKQSDNNEPKKKAKTENAKKKEEEVVKKISGEDAKKMFQRLFSETDEIAMLRGFLDFTSTRGDPYENMDAFCDYVKTLIDFNASKAQIVTKLQRCKKKFVNIVKNALKRGKTEDKVTCSKDLDQKAFELSRKIWGSKGVLPAKPRFKSKEAPLTLLQQMPKKEWRVERHKGSGGGDVDVSSSREVAMFFKAENSGVLGLDVSTVSEVWDMVEDGEKKREVEEKLKKLKDMQVELCLQRTALVDTTAKMIFKGNASS